MDKREFKITEDGSHTLYVPNIDETYHSTHGAIQESAHVFIQTGLKFIDKKQINVLEIGFGTGLNAFLSLIETFKSSRIINYTTIEAYPLPNHITKELNYPVMLSSNEEETRLFDLLHQSEWEGYQSITDGFSLNKIKITLDEFVVEKEQFDLIYFDAFGPDVQPDMWTTSVFEKMYNALSKGGVLVTYCAKGIVKRSLKEVGFNVENLPGPPGKREITRAIK